MSDTAKIKENCLCGSVQVTLARQPEFINDCNCSLCSKSGAVWGYFNCSDVEISGSTRTYQRNDRPSPSVQIHFCSSCGSVTHWSLTEASLKKYGPVDRMGVNMRLFDGNQLDGVEIRFPDGKAWSGEGDYQYRRDEIVLGTDDY